MIRTPISETPTSVSKECRRSPPCLVVIRPAAGLLPAGTLVSQMGGGGGGWRLSAEYRGLNE